MYYLFIILFVLLLATVVFIKYENFKISENKFWLISILVINLVLTAFFIGYYNYKAFKQGALGYKGYIGEEGNSLENEVKEVCSDDYKEC